MIQPNVSYKQRQNVNGLWKQGLSNVRCGNSDHSRVELICDIQVEGIAGIDTRQDAKQAITIIDDVNAELATHANLLTGELG